MIFGQECLLSSGDQMNSVNMILIVMLLVAFLNDIKVLWNRAFIKANFCCYFWLGKLLYLKYTIKRLTLLTQNENSYPAI